MIHKQLSKNYGGFEALSVYKIDAQSFSGSVPTTNMLTRKKISIRYPLTILMYLKC